jgi:uncharacterized coiled-coil DUF342 family protein
MRDTWLVLTWIDMSVTATMQKKHADEIARVRAQSLERLEEATELKARVTEVEKEAAAKRGPSLERPQMSNSREEVDELQARVAELEKEVAERVAAKARLRVHDNKHAEELMQLAAQIKDARIEQNNDYEACLMQLRAAEKEFQRSKG